MSVWIAVLCVAAVGGLMIWVDNPIISLNNEIEKLRASAGLLVVCLLLLFFEGLWALGVRKLAALKFSSSLHGAISKLLPKNLRSKPQSNTVKEFLCAQYGFFWHRKVRLLLVFGESAQVEAIAPGLVKRGWLEGPKHVLLHGGSLQAEPAQGLIAEWQELTRWRGFEGVVWALSKEQRRDNVAMNQGLRHCKSLAKALRWRLSMHLWQVCNSQWLQDTREVQPVGCVISAGATQTQFNACLEGLRQPLREQGLMQVQNALGHDFLLRLSRDLAAEGSAAWQTLFAAVSNAQGVSLRGLWFSLSLPQALSAVSEHHWQPSPSWLEVVGGPSTSPQRLGWHTSRVGYAMLLCFTGLFAAGVLLSFVNNRTEIARVAQALETLQHPAQANDPLAALNELVRELSRLDYRTEHGAPWYQRFGLDRTHVLHDSLLPHFVQASNQLLRDPAAAQLQQQLSALVKLPPATPERSKRARAAYDQLKAYLMLARPEKADAAFLVKALGATEPSLWSFYGQLLPANPQWRIKADPRLIAQVRQILLTQLGQRNAESSLYQQALDAAGPHYPELTLQQMVGDTDASDLFFTTASVPGVFTRQAWEGQVSAAIEAAAKARREEIDWVLSDNPNDITGELSADALKQRLTARYFRDYSSAWLDFLNTLRWQQNDSLEEVIAQLTLMADVRQSPLIALMNTLAYQGQAGMQGQALADSLIKSAQNLIGQDKAPVIDQRPLGLDGPLDATFGPLLALLGKNPEVQRSDDSLSLQAFLTRVTGVRLKLQQVANAPDPQAMTQALAQTVFQGKRVDLSDTQSYGSLIAASLGAEWGAVAQTLFVQPLDQAWQRVLQPAAAGLNRDWQRAVVNEWNAAFTGRYPFAATGSDASLPKLGQMIRADSGRIEQFLRGQLTGLLRKEGSRWVTDPRHSQGVRFNPEFLAAINQLGHLADVLYTDGGMGLSFELQGKPVRDVVQTTFTLNGAKHHYFNQRESWQRFRWPGLSDYPGASLTWTSVHSGERLFADLQGTWGLIRLLEQAQVTALDDSDSRFRLTLRAADGLDLTWNMRTELATGPLALLKLRNFSLPEQIFLTDRADARRIAQNEAYQ
ncbi:ImcF-related family protein [Pseudomonas putida]